MFLLAPLAGMLRADAPRAIFPEPRFVFGTARQGTTVRHEFVLMNEGEDPLRILGVRASAPLLLARMPAQVEPGTQVTLRVQLDTSRLSGPYNGQVRIQLNDPSLPEAILLLEGRIVPPIELLPHPAFFLGGRRGEQRRAAIEVINHEPEPLRIESVEHSRERFATELETIEEGRRYRLSLILNPDGPGGRKTEPILVKTSSRTTPSITIPANTYLRERVYTFPDEIDFGILRLADLKAHPELLQMTAQTLMVYQSGGSDFRVKLGTDLPLLDLQCERGSKGDRYQGTITLIGEKLTAGPIDGMVIVETDDLEFPLLRVPVRGMIR